MLRSKALGVCARMARRLVGAVVPRSVHVNLNMGLFLRAVLCSTTPLPAYKIDFRAQKSSKFSRGLRPRTPGRLPLLGRTCLSGFGPVSPQRSGDSARLACIVILPKEGRCSRGARGSKRLQEGAALARGPPVLRSYLLRPRKKTPPWPQSRL